MTKKDLLEAIEDMPMDAPIMVCQVGGLMTEVADVCVEFAHALVEKLKEK